MILFGGMIAAGIKIGWIKERNLNS